jgi:hypothetical protein
MVFCPKSTRVDVYWNGDKRVADDRVSGQAFTLITGVNLCRSVSSNHPGKLAE